MERGYVTTLIPEQRKKKIFKVTIIGSLVNFFLLLLKFFIGYIGHSSALIADAVHSLSDFITDIFVLAFVKISARPPDRSHHYGHEKFEAVASFFIGLTLMIVAGGIIITGGIKLYKWRNGADILSPEPVVLWIALFSIVVKEVLYRFTMFYGKVLCAEVLIDNAWHHRSDALSSVGAFIGIGGAIVLGDRWTILDPITSIGIGFFLITTSVSLLKNSIDNLTDRSLPHETEQEIINIIISEPNISEPHNLHTRRMGNNISIEVHVRMDGNLSLEASHRSTTLIEKRLKERFGKSTHIIIHTEPITNKT